MKIYTKSGDGGETSLFSGGRIRKDDLRVRTYGTIDELNSMLGVVRAHQPHEEVNVYLETVQNQLFRLGADMATPLHAKVDWVVRVDAETIAWLESTIDTMTDVLPPLKNFILPGGTLSASHLHVARTICRRAERFAVSLEEREPINDQAIPYLNRLSDWLFTLARYENFKQGVNESQWVVS